MARAADTTPPEDEVLGKKPRHPDATAMIMLTTVMLIGAISFTWADLFGRYLGLADEDVQALEQESTPADAALDAVIRKDVDSDEMKILVQKARGRLE